MTQPRPSADELVDAVRAFLEDDLMPTLDGRQRFHARVAANVLGIVGRELRDGPEAAGEERTRLIGLLGVDGDAGEDTEALSRWVATSIRTGDVDIADPDLLDHLRRSTDADLRIANPRYAPDH